MHESSGVLEPVVRAYLQGDELDAGQVDLMRAYLYQGVMAPVWGPSSILEALRLRAFRQRIESRRETSTMPIEAMEEIGMDPL